MTLALVAAFTVALQTPLVTALVSCDKAPDCSPLRRYGCDRFADVQNSCGECLPGQFGATGRMNAVCLSNGSCGVIFPGQAACANSEGFNPQVPFLVPFGRCVCDDGTGLMWPTAPGMCARVFVSFAGVFTLQKCKSSTCDPASCMTLSTWMPVKYGSEAKFDCRRKGSDAVTLSDGCTSEDTGQFPDSALCGHAGYVASKSSTIGNHAVTCSLAPKCPESVLGDTRLDQSCCNGNFYSYTVTEYGKERDKLAPGFCRVGLSEGEECSVRTIAPGWRGCTCLDTDGLPRPDRQCTVDCTPPECDLPAGGIPQAPEAWLSSEVPTHLWQPPRSTSGTRAAASPCTLLLVVMQAVAAWTAFSPLLHSSRRAVRQ